MKRWISTMDQKKKLTGEGVEVEILMGPGGAIGAVTLKLALSDSSRFQGQLLKSF